MKEEKLTSENTSTQESSKPSKNIFQKHPMTFLLLGALLISILWGILSVNRMEKEHSESITQLELKHQAKLDSVNLMHASQVIETLTWAVRSEMTRDNLEQVNTYFIQLIKEPSILSIQLVDANTGEVILATNKKDEGTIVTDTFILEAKSPASERRDGVLTSVAPVYGLSAQLATLVMQWEK